MGLNKGRIRSVKPLHNVAVRVKPVTSQIRERAQIDRAGVRGDECVQDLQACGAGVRQGSGWTVAAF